MYELMIVAATKGSEALIGRVERFVKDAEVRDLKVDKLGKKQLAYKIKKQTEADYFLLNFDADADSLKSITDKLRLEQEDVLRYMLVKLKAFKPSKRGVLKQKEVSTEKKEKEKAKVTVVTKTSGKQKEKKGKEVAKASKTSKVKKEKKGSKK